jgi:hypothetical protein
MFQLSILSVLPLNLLRGAGNLGEVCLHEVNVKFNTYKEERIDTLTIMYLKQTTFLAYRS